MQASQSQTDSKKDSSIDIINQINQFREKPQSYLNKDQFPENSEKKKEYKEFINKLTAMPPLVLDKELCKIAEEEMKKFSGNSEYNKYQIGEEFQSSLSKDFTKNEVALIAIEGVGKIEYIIQTIIFNDSDTEKKGRNIFNNIKYTHIGLFKSEEDSIILIFAKKEIKEKAKEEKNLEETIIDNKNQNEKIEETGETKEEEIAMKLTEEQNMIMEQIKEFRENPKSFLEKKNAIKVKKKRIDFENYINSLDLDKMTELKPEKELFDIAKEEVKNLSENDKYDKIQINENFKPKISQNFSKNEIALIAIEEIDKIENIIQKIVTNDLDKEKKGREIISNINYTHIGFCKSEEDYSIIFIFAKKELKKEKEEEEVGVEEDEQIDFTEDEKKIMNQIREFRENPKSFLNKKDSINTNRRKRNDFENFINTLSKMDELKPNKKLCDIAKEEAKLVSEDDKYNYKHIQIGENIRKEIKEKLPDKEIALLVIEEVENIEDIIKKIIINSYDEEKKGRKILTDTTYTHIGLSQFCPQEENDDKPIVIIFSKNVDKDNNPEIKKESLQTNEEGNERKVSNCPKLEGKHLKNVDNNEPNQESIDKKKEFENNSSVGIDADNSGPKDTKKSKNKEDMPETPKDNEERETKPKAKEDIDNKQEKPKDKEKEKKGIKQEINNVNNNKKQNESPSNNTIIIKKSQKKQIFLFTSLINLDYEISSIQIKKKEGNKYESYNLNNLEYSEEKDSKQKLYKRLYFKLNLEKNKSFKIIINSNNNNYYTSEEIKIENENCILGCIRLFSNNYQLNTQYLTNEAILYHNLNLLDRFNSEPIYKKYAIEKYIPNKNISLNDLLIIMKYSADYEATPLFLKDINISNIQNQFIDKININLDNNIFFNKLGELIINGTMKKNEKEKCYLFLLDFYAWIYYKFNQNKFKELINSINSGEKLFKASLSKLIANKIIKIEELKSTFEINQNIIIPLIIENSLSFDELKNIFSKSKSIVEALNLVNIYYELIVNKLDPNKEQENPFVLFFKNIFSWDKKKIPLPAPSEKDDIDLIFNLQKSILEKEKKNNFEYEIINFENILSKLIDINVKTKNLDNLVKIKNMIIHLKQNGKDIKKLNENLNDAIHDTGISLALTRKLSNKEIISFIKNDDYYKLDDYKTSSKRDPYVFKYFNFFDENKEGFGEFINLKLYNKFPAKKRDLYKIFIEKLKKFDDLNILFELFPKEELDSDFIYTLLWKLNSLYFFIPDSKKDNVSNLGENIYIILLNMERNKMKVNNLTQIIEVKLDRKAIKKVYIKVLSKNDNKITDYIKDEFSNFFFYDIKDFTVDEIYLLIKSCSNNKRFLKLIFNNIDDYAIKEEDFYSTSKSPNFKLYELFIENGYINEPLYLETSYFEAIGKMTGKLSLDIKDLKIPFSKLSNLIEKNEDEFLSKLKLVFMEKSIENVKFINFQIIGFFKLCKKNINCLNKILDYLTLFEPKEKNLINTLQKTINNLRQKNIKEILNENETKQILNIKDLIKKSENLKFKQSIFFMKFHEELKKEKGLNCDEIQLF